MSVPLLDLKAQYRTIRGEIEAAVKEVLGSQYFILGPKVKEFEEAIAAYCGCTHAVGVSSGTDALLISMMAEGIGPGDEVITTPYSFFATAGCISRLGARPVFVDIERVSCNINPNSIESVITNRTKAIIPVHLYGQVAEMDPIMEIAERHGLAVIEDAAQAIGAEYHGKRAGSIGHYGCFSFFPSKNLGGAGDGGMVVTNDPERAQRLTVIRNHGAEPKYYHKTIGGNFRLDALQAAVLLVKLKYLDKWTEGRQANADTYRELFSQSGHMMKLKGDEDDFPFPLRLAGFKEVVVPEPLQDRRHIYNQFVIRIDRRDKMRDFLRSRDIGHEVYYPVPFHLQQCFSDLGYSSGKFPESESAAAYSLALPIYPELTRDMMEEVVGVISDFMAQG